MVFIHNGFYLLHFFFGAFMECRERMFINGKNILFPCFHIWAFKYFFEAGNSESADIAGCSIRKSRDEYLAEDIWREIRKIIK
jgi:hypothetical protein